MGYAHPGSSPDLEICLGRLNIRLMKALTVLGIGAALYGLSRVSSKVDAVKAFKYGLADWPKVSYQGGQVILDFPLVITNVSREPFDVLKVYGQMLVKGNPIGDFMSAGRVVISPNSKSLVPVTVSAYLTNAVSGLISGFITKSGEAEFSLKGTAVTSVVSIPFSVDFKL